MRVCVIPARGGSKRIPGKNIRIFCGRPMLAWSVAAARNSACFDKIIVSTDDRRIAAVAEAEGAEAPFIRPPELSGAYAGTMPVIAHAIEWLRAQGMAATEACCVYATAPFLQAEDIRRGLDQLLATHADFVFSATAYPFPIQRAFRLNREGRAEMFDPGNFNRRSQDLEKAYHDAAQFYWGTTDSWVNETTLFSSGAAPYLLPRYRVQDIDTEEDWLQAELMFSALKERSQDAS